MVAVSLPPTSQAYEREAERHGGGSVHQPDRIGTEVTCFMRGFRWNTALDGPIPTCTLDVRDNSAGLARPKPGFAGDNAATGLDACFINGFRWSPATDGPIPTC
jgi:hypothetical protein